MPPNSPQKAINSLRTRFGTKLNRRSLRSKDCLEGTFLWKVGRRDMLLPAMSADKTYENRKPKMLMEGIFLEIKIGSRRRRTGGNRNITYQRVTGINTERRTKATWVITSVRKTLEAIIVMNSTTQNYQISTKM